MLEAHGTEAAGRLQGLPILAVIKAISERGGSVVGLDSSMLHLLGLRAGALVRDLRRAFTLFGFETS